MNQQAVNLALLLKQQILLNNEKARITEAQIAQWGKTADLLLRLDSRSYGLAVDVLLWSQQDEFWKCNILSMKKFRVQFDQLYMKMRRELEKRKTAGQRTAENLQRVFGDSE